MMSSCFSAAMMRPTSRDDESAVELSAFATTDPVENSEMSGA